MQNVGINMVEKKYKLLDESDYKSVVTKSWFLSKEQMTELIDKYEKKEITHEFLETKWKMHIEYLRKHNPKKLAEIQLDLWDQMKKEHQLFRRVIKPSWNIR